MNVCVFKISTEISENINVLWYLRHSLINGFNPIAHGKLIDYFLGSIIKENLPGFIPFDLWDFHCTIRFHFSQVMEQILKASGFQLFSNSLG